LKEGQKMGTKITVNGGGIDKIKQVKDILISNNYKPQTKGNEITVFQRDYDKWESRKSWRKIGCSPAVLDHNTREILLRKMRGLISIEEI